MKELNSNLDAKLDKAIMKELILSIASPVDDRIKDLAKELISASILAMAKEIDARFNKTEETSASIRRDIVRISRRVEDMIRHAEDTAPTVNAVTKLQHSLSELGQLLDYKLNTVDNRLHSTAHAIEELEQKVKPPWPTFFNPEDLEALIACSAHHADVLSRWHAE